MNSLTDSWIQKLSESSQTIVPTKLEYTVATGKEVLTLLRSAFGVMPVPLLQDAIGVALKVIQLCEVGCIPPSKVARRLINGSHQDALVVEKKVKELQERVGHLMIVILHRVTPKNEDGSEETIVTTMKGIEEDIRALVRYDL